MKRDGFVNNFTPFRACAHCADQINFVVSPTSWPIDTVAKACYACGRVLAYVDDLQLFTPREAVVEYTHRFGGVVKRGVATPVDLVDREKILGALELGYSAPLIAMDFKCSLRYVELIAEHAGFA